MKQTLFHASLLSLIVIGAKAQNSSSATTACDILNSTLPGLVYFPGSENYTNDIAHAAVSGTQNSTCSVEPTSNDDISTILKVVGRDDIRAPFAVKSGGHASNMSFSSTLGVQIAMVRFNEVSYDSAASTVRIGSGLTWDQVFAQLEPHNVTVVGGRIPGVGVGGLMLGGGFSYFTDQYGLAVDNMVSYDLVLPNGTFVQVTNSSQPDLFFALKGGFNNYGIVTSFTVNAHPLSGVWAGMISFPENVTDLVYSTVANFSSQNTDLKAQMTLTYQTVGGQSAWQAVLFYGAPEQPAAFEPFLRIPSLSSDVKVRSFTDFLASLVAFSSVPVAIREAQHVVPILQYTVPLMEAMQTQVDLFTSQAVNNNRSVFAGGINIEPFTHPFGHSTPSAYPHLPSREVTPFQPVFAYTDEADDAYFQDAVKQLANAIQAFAIQEGQSNADDLCYPNYAAADTPLELMYGENVERLREIKTSIDPRNVMSLTGGFKF